MPHHSEHSPEEKPGPAARAAQAGTALGEGGLSAPSSEAADASRELGRAGSPAAGSSAGQAAPGGAGSGAAASVPKASLSCFTRRSTLSAGEGEAEDGMSRRDAQPAHPPTRCPGEAALTTRHGSHGRAVDTGRGRARVPLLGDARRRLGGAGLRAVRWGAHHLRKGQAWGWRAGAAETGGEPAGGRLPRWGCAGCRRWGSGGR